jgi:lysine 2,3-aminomutase
MDKTFFDPEEAEPPSQRLNQRTRSNNIKVAPYPKFDSDTGIDVLCQKPEAYLTFHQTNLKKFKIDLYSSFAISPSSKDFLNRFFPGTSIHDWNDWKWQLKNSVKSFEQLRPFITLSKEEEELIITQHGENRPLAITPYYLSLLAAADPAQPLRRTVIPTTAEYTKHPCEEEDPLGEEHDSPVPGLVHRYPDRVLFLVTNFCSVLCRYCTRSRMVITKKKTNFQLKQWEDALSYIENHPEIRDVLISGGDPLTLSNYKLEWLLKRLRKIPHVEIIRLGTKVPVVLPQRVTHTLCDMLKKYHPLFMSIHFTHPDELTPETREACTRLANAGIPLGSQTVLLAGINDNVPTMKKLMQGLLKIRVKPYYLYQCDAVVGTTQFRTPVAKGLEIIEGLRGHTSGYAIPTYVIDAPNGGGKIPLLPHYVQGYEGDNLVLRNYEGLNFKYYDPNGANTNYSGAVAPF